MKKHVCIICGYVYDQDLPFDELPDDYECPICGVGKNKFEVLVHNHKETFLKINYGLYIITAKEDSLDNGCVIDALMQLTENPPVVAFSLNKVNKTHDMVMHTKEFNISVLTEDAPKELFHIFSAKSGWDINKFADCTDIKRSPNGIAYLPKYVNSHMSGKIIDTIDSGSHTLFRAEITDSEVMNNKDTLTYSEYRKGIKYKQMFCFQCQQTARGTGCAVAGVCGKKADVAELQDKMTGSLVALARTVNGRNNAKTDQVVIDALFTGITNVNFNPESIRVLARKIADLTTQFGGAKEMDMRDLWGDNEDVRSLKALILFGLRGISAYAHHALMLGKTDDEVNAFFYTGLKAIGDDLTVPQLLEIALETGRINLKCMELLDHANTGAYGVPTPVKVTTNIEKGPFIVVTGHDLHDLKLLLEQTEGRGVNIYTHGEMLPAHGYPELRKHAHLKGNFGTAWQNQQKEFSDIPAPILFTTNCLMPPKQNYTDRVFTTSVVDYPGLKHIDDSKDFSEVIKSAIALGGYSEEHKMQGINGGDILTTGFSHKTVLSLADKVIDAVKSGAVKHFFLVGGCDGAHTGRNYYTDFVKKSPKDSIILTLACGKFRFNDLDLGTIGDFPRIMDMGQCNDAYGAIKVALALSEAFGCGVNDLPLSLILSWYEQKAVAILLTLLFLGIKNIYLGPSLPAFVSPNVLSVLVENYNVTPISTPEEDLKKILG